MGEVESIVTSTKFLVIFFIFFAFAGFIIPNITQSPQILFGSLVVIYTSGFLLLVVLITNNNTYKVLNDQSWFRSIKKLSLLGYTISSGIWASGIINETFEVGASNFPVTLIIFSLIYFVTMYLWPLAQVGYLLMFFSGFIVFFILLFYRGFLKKIFMFLIPLSLLVMMAINIATIREYYPELVKKIAVWGDFNMHFKCDKKSINKNTSAVVFLPSGKIIAHIINPDNGAWSFKIENCDIINSSNN